MTVYVDDAQHAYGRMQMCHCTADTVNELNAAMLRIGVSLKWTQNKGAHYHFDICKSKRALAIQNGAVEVTQREMAALARRLMQQYVKTRTGRRG